jgi:hypothetical protein
MMDLRTKPRCHKCGSILTGTGDVLYCTNRKCDFERPKTEEERKWLRD